MASINTGAALGGAANARASRESRELEGRRLDIVESQFKAEQDAEQIQGIRERFNGLTALAVEMVQNIPIPRDDPRFEAAFKPIRDAVASLGARAQQSFPGQINAQSNVALFDSALANTPTQIEAAEAEAAANVAGAKATVDAIGGSARDVEVLLGTESLTPLQPPELVQLQDARDAASAAGDTARAAEITNVINRRGTVTGTTEFDPGKPEEFATALTTPTKEDVERIRAEVRDNQSSFETAANTLAAVEEAGGLSVGFAGAAVESITGVIGNLGSLGEAMNAGFENLVGVDLDNLTVARTRLREGVASALPEIVEDRSGRFTKDERDIAAATLRGITPTSNIDQVIASYQTYFRILNASDVRKAGEIIRGANIDIGKVEAGVLTNPEGINRLADILRGLGMSEDRIEEIIDQVIP